LTSTADIKREPRDCDALAVNPQARFWIILCLLGPREHDIFIPATNATTVRLLMGLPDRGGGGARHHELKTRGAQYAQ
jgi:hypothetical protein